MFVIGARDVLELDLEALLQVLRDTAEGTLRSEDAEAARSHLALVLRSGEELTKSDRPFEARVAEGRYLAVGSLGHLALSIVLGPLLHLVAAGSAVSASRRLLRFDRDWRPRLLAIYVHLDSDDRAVFEAIHDAQSRWIVANYDAAESGDFGRAFGRVAPTPLDLASALADDMSEAGVRRALADLLSRGILSSDGIRYWIRF